MGLVCTELSNVTEQIVNMKINVFYTVPPRLVNMKINVFYTVPPRLPLKPRLEGVDRRMSS